MIDLTTNYLGLRLAHPVVASASPLSKSLDGIRRLEDGGASAIVLFSLFEEQIRRENEAFDHLIAAGSESFGESLSYFPDLDYGVAGADGYLELVSAARHALGVPVIASLNGSTPAGWTGTARALEQAGAHAIELNIFHIATDPATTGAEVEQRYLDVVRAVRQAVRIPLAVKLGPFFSAFGEMAGRIVQAGADGLVLFNRFYQPDFDLERMDVVPDLALSTPLEIRLPLLWIGVLRGHLTASLAATTGVWSEVEVVKYLLAGADAVMTTSSLLKRGPHHVQTLVDGLRTWMERRGYGSVTQLKGAMSQQKVGSPESFERANYISILQSWKNPFAG
jgi:dihydroorotate dehydrogenase (fumarate)